MFKRFVMVLSVLFLVLAGSAVASAINYAITDLGSLGTGTNDTSYAFAINASGVVTGYSKAAPSSHAFTYSGSGPMVDLGLEASAPGTGNSIMYAINASGKVAGRGTTSAGTRALYGTPFQSLGLMPGIGYSSSIAYALNTSGNVAGYSYISSGGFTPMHGFVTDINGGAMYDLGLLSGPYFGHAASASNAKGINDNGYVVGYGSDNSGGTSGMNLPYDHAAVWQYNIAGGVLTKTATDIHSAVALSGEDNELIGSNAVAINNNNQVVGKVFKTGYGTSDYAHAFLYTIGGAVTKDIGHLSGSNSTEAYAINNLGQVVGTDYSSATPTAKRAFYYDGSTISDLNAAGTVVNLGGWLLKTAQGINDAGKIVGYGTNPSGATHAFLLNPLMLGDATLDGTVDISDLSKVLTNYDKTSMTWADGDFSGDGTVDISDLSNVLTNYNKSMAAGGVKAVPEPGTLALLAAGLFGLVAWTWRKR